MFTVFDIDTVYGNLFPTLFRSRCANRNKFDLPTLVCTKLNQDKYLQYSVRPSPIIYISRGMYSYEVELINAFITIVRFSSISSILVVDAWTVQDLLDRMNW